MTKFEEQLKAENDRLNPENDRLKLEVATLREQVEALTHERDDAVHRATAATARADQTEAAAHKALAEAKAEVVTAILARNEAENVAGRLQGEHAALVSAVAKAAGPILSVLETIRVKSV